MDKRISQEKLKVIIREAKIYQNTIEQMFEDTIFELHMKLNLSEDVVRKIFEEESVS